MMLWLLLGAAALCVFLAALRLFETANVKTIKSLFGWIVALGGLSLALLLIMSGRGAVALGAILLFGPMLWQQWKGAQPAGPKPFARPSRSASALTRAEAYQVLGLKPGATESEIRDAHHRLMKAAHPDHGGSDWLATRINEARDILLG